MDVCVWDVHQDTYLDIWVRRVIIIKDACYVLLLWPLLDHHNCFHQVLLQIFSFMSIILYSFMSCLSAYILFHQPPALVVLYHVLIYARHLAFLSPLAWGVLSDSPGSSCPGHGAWSVWVPPVADQSGAAVAWISSIPSRAPSFQAPCVPLEFSFCKLVSACVLFILVHLFVISQLRISVM